ncbi:MAG: tripeptide aminopeptidase [Pirellulaceae bacterium]|jgi:tripeptide aminopeptidase
MFAPRRSRPIHFDFEESAMNKQRLLERFLRYVAIDSTADETTTDYPSSAGQLELGKLLLAELLEMGIANAVQDEYGLVIATHGDDNGESPVILLNSHFDTSPETSGTNIKAQVIEDYQGGDIQLPGDSSKVITVAENPELEGLHGCTIITTDGTTLLGGDDKAGIAVIMEAVQHLIENPELQHAPIRILFTCDEEIGRGIQHVDVPGLKAVVGYTLDGPGANGVDVETFSADVAVVKVTGINIHPSIAKNRMVNAMRAAGDFAASLPRETLSPEKTDGREGFLHPYHVEGGVAEVVMRIILRDFDTPKLSDHADLLRQIASDVEAAYPGVSIDVEVSKQYRNMADGLAKEPRAVEYALRAHERLGRTAKTSVIRGGTDGSVLTERGLPTPNLSTGQHNPHSPLEWACLDEMEQAVEVLIELAQVWAE